jgi:hypothetical protein
MLFIVLFALVFSIIRIINTQDIYAYKNEQAVLEGNKGLLKLNFYK